ncbi:glycosyltransferase [Occultella glacieicola]|uniref:4,4'-diaponeurosporenoate glycosyltransferase n=1 Tax=Occultella glacieicola TaxID=2518684 RepID=A0ABY2E3I2_9MICO|nr:glycosyltransferase [Occultella glacieicola]TDE94060.1 glycosyltransferase [Occultella glacieicola]
MVSIIVPAHNEERSLPRLLDALDDPRWAPEEVIVVANGCSDRTAQVARARGVTVIETPIPSKIKALALGDARATSFPRIYVDGDVVLGADSARALCGALTDGVQAAGPIRSFPMARVSAPVRWYYDVWQRLDGVRTELYGRGVVAVSEVGHARIRDWPETMSDDLHLAMSFAPDERTVVAAARVTIMPPKTYRDLLRRRVRAMTGNARMAGTPEAPAVRSAGASPAAIGRMVAAEPRLLPGAAVFVVTAAISKLLGRRAARRGDTTWLRDESSRR